MNKTNSIFEEFLIETGLNKSCRDNDDLKLSLYHDVGIYGDIAESYIELLEEKYGVDISEFNFEKHFPLEFPGDTTLQSFLFSFLPFLAARYNAKKTFEKLTFLDIKNALDSHSLK